MNYLSKILIYIFFLLLPFQTNASGMPVVDTNVLMKQISDALYLLTSIETLLGEVSGDKSTFLAMGSLKKEIDLYQKAIRDYESLAGAVDEVSYYDGGRSKVLSAQINSVSRHIRKLKTIVSLATTVGARPEALNASMQILRDERAREKERFEVALKAIEEKERIREIREKITRKTRLKRSLYNEMNEINNITRDKSVKPIGVSSNNNKFGGLW